MKRRSKCSAPMACAAIPSPKLSDEAVIQIHDVMHHALDLFEARYGAQIHRFYTDLCSDSRIDPHRPLNPDDPPF